MSEVRVGISGWSYAPWRKVFYPVGLRQADELKFASRQFSSIELNGSFYSLQRPESYRSWHRQTPDDFVFAVKGGRFITHMKRLRDVETALANFFASGVLCLERKLGPFLWQLPPQLAFSEDVLRRFFELLPKTTQELARLAKRHDLRLKGRAFTEAKVAMPVRHALEVRHQSFIDERYVRLLREYGIASCVADSAGLYPVIDDLTADFVYVRLHGNERLYVSGYSRRQLLLWAERVRAWREAGRSVYVYFDNDVKVRAPFDAQNLERLLAGKRAAALPTSIRDVTEEPRSGWPAWLRVGRTG
ncbi:MAG TPA: DUF72 domain-containing protein [Polyangiaceae bacterium]|nr:DUF72 domain-containing protein [Polyangiaceae bacterium]